VREFVEAAGHAAGMQIEWEGSGLEEVGIDRRTGHKVVSINSAFYRPAEVDLLRADSSKAKNELGWQPEISFEDLVSEMVEADMKNEARRKAD